MEKCSPRSNRCYLSTNLLAIKVLSWGSFIVRPRGKQARSFREFVFNLIETSLIPNGLVSKLFSRVCSSQMGKT